MRHLTLKRALLLGGVVFLLAAVGRELLLSNLQPFDRYFVERLPGELARVAVRGAAGLINATQYRKHEVRNYIIYLNITESRMMYSRAAGNYEPTTFESVEHFMKPGMTFVDVGANKGDYSLFAGHLVGPAGLVLAVEPVPENSQWLRRSIRVNGLHNVQVVELALASTEGEADLFLGEKSGWHSLRGGGKGLTTETITVKTTRLDSLLREQSIKRVDGIRIDVEGAELDVLLGAQETIETHRPVLWLDLHPKKSGEMDQILKFFKARNYRIAPLSDPEKKPDSFGDQPQAVLFTPRETSR